MRLASVLAFVVFTVFALPAGAQFERFQQSCTVPAPPQSAIGGTVAGARTAVALPACTVEVLVAGSRARAPLYAGPSGPALPNPFVASPTGDASFYALSSECYEVVLSGGSGPEALRAPLHVPHVCPAMHLGTVQADRFPVATAPPWNGYYGGEPTALMSLGPGHRMEITSASGLELGQYLPPFFASVNGATRQIWPNGTMVDDQRFGQSSRTYFNTRRFMGDNPYAFGARDHCVWRAVEKDDLFSRYTPEVTCGGITNTVDLEGYSFGNPDHASYPGNQGWLVTHAQRIEQNCNTAAICGAVQLETRHLGLGDTNSLDINASTKWGATAASDEMQTGVRNTTQEVFSLFSGTVERAPTPLPSGDQVITIHDPASAEWLGQGQTLVDTTPAKMLHARQSFVSTPANGFSVMQLTSMDGSPLKSDLQPSVCSTLAAPVVTGIPEPLTQPIQVTGWRSTQPGRGQATFTFTVKGAIPHPGQYLALAGFRSSSAPGWLNGSIVQVTAADASSFSAETPSAAGAIAGQAETSATAQPWRPSHVPDGQPAAMHVRLQKPEGGAFNTTEPLFIEDIFPEQVMPRSVDVQADGTVDLVVPLRFEHPATRLVCQGGLAGYRVNMVDYSGIASTYVQYISGSFKGNRIREGAVLAGGMMSYPLASEVQIMPGAEVLSVLNPSTHVQDFSTFVIAPSKGFDAGDKVLQPNNIAAGWHGYHALMAGFSPYAYYTAFVAQFPGASLRESYGMAINFSGNQASDPRNGYPGIASEGGKLGPPTGVLMIGVARHALDLTAPPDEAILHVNDCRDAAFLAHGGAGYSLWRQDGAAPASIVYTSCSRDPKAIHTLTLFVPRVTVPGELNVNGKLTLPNLKPGSVCVDSDRNLSTDCPSPPAATASSGAGPTATPAGENTVPFTPTPGFDPAFAVSILTLTGNIASFTLPGARPGQRETLVFCQDRAGGHTVTPPANVRGFFHVGPRPESCSAQTFVWSKALSAWMADSPGVVNE